MKFNTRPRRSRVTDSMRRVVCSMGRARRAHAAERAGKQIEPPAEVEIGAARRRVEHGHSRQDPAFGEKQQVVHGPFRRLVGGADDDVADRSEAMALGEIEGPVEGRANVGAVKPPKLLGMSRAQG